MNNFPRAYRLLSKSEYKHIFDQANKVSQRDLLALYKKNNKPHDRIGIIVGRKVSKLAVIRNQIKRVVRESFRTKPNQFNGLDIVIIARHSCEKLDKSQLREGIDKLWQKLAIQCQKR